MNERDLKEQFVDYNESLLATALRLTRNPDDAEDLRQKTLLRALRFEHQFEPGTHLGAWLYTILRTTYINAYRHSQKHPECSLEEMNYEYWCCAPEKSEQAKLRVLREVIWNARGSPEKMTIAANARYLKEILDDATLCALESITEEYAFAVIVCDLLDFSYKEAVAIIGCPEGTVMSRLFRGRRALREYLSGEKKGG